MIDLKTLHDRLHYDPQTGIFTWRKCLGSHKGYREGRAAGTPHNAGYWQISLSKKLYLAHRLAWFYMTGEWPAEIDHIDCDRRNNAWANLRLAERRENVGNAKMRNDNKTGFKGVCFIRGKFVAQIGRGKGSHLGAFDTPEEAHLVYQRAAEERWGKFARPHGN